MSFRDLLAEEFLPYGQLSESQLDQLDRHYSLVMHWNERLNLTRIRSLQEVVQFHYCESLFLARTLPPGPLRVMDVGSGAGFPGIPVAVFRKDCDVSLIEAHQRKAVFLREAARGLSNVSVIADRAEGGKASADWLVARAVRPNLVLSLRLTPAVALLTTTSDLEVVPEPFDVVRVPWGKDRIIAMFHVKHAKIDNRGEGNRDHESEGRRR